MVSDDTYYEVLGVGPDATRDEIRTAFRRLIRQVHPDHGGSDALFRRVNEAYATLCDPQRRAAYDKALNTPHSDNYARGSSNPSGSGDSSGWVRVDDPPDFDGASPRGDERSRSSGDPPGPRMPTDSNAPSSVYRERPTPSGIGRLFVEHPAGFVTVLGLITMVLAPSILRLDGAVFALAGFALFSIGVIALIGHHRVQAKGWKSRSTIEDIDVMTGAEFELFLVPVFKRAGYRVRHTGGRGDFGCDLLVERSGCRTIVQAKRSSSPVGHRAIQEAVAAKGPYNALGAIVVTNSSFTAHAQELAGANHVILWDRWKLLGEIDRMYGGMRLPGQGSVGISGNALLAEEIRAGISVLGKVAIVALNVFVLASAASRSGSHRPRR